MSPWLSPNQVLARIWRPGTTAQRVVTYRLLTTGSLEEKVHLPHVLWLRSLWLPVSPIRRQLLKDDYPRVRYLVITLPGLPAAAPQGRLLVRRGGRRVGRAPILYLGRASPGLLTSTCLLLTAYCRVEVVGAHRCYTSDELAQACSLVPTSPQYVPLGAGLRTLTSAYLLLTVHSLLWSATYLLYDSGL